MDGAAHTARGPAFTPSPEQSKAKQSKGIALAKEKREGPMETNCCLDVDSLRCTNKTMCPPPTTNF